MFEKISGAYDHLSFLGTESALYLTRTAAEKGVELCEKISSTTIGFLPICAPDNVISSKFNPLFW